MIVQPKLPTKPLMVKRIFSIDVLNHDIRTIIPQVGAFCEASQKNHCFNYYQLSKKTTKKSWWTQSESNWRLCNANAPYCHYTMGPQCLYYTTFCVRIRRKWARLIKSLCIRVASASEWRLLWMALWKSGTPNLLVTIKLIWLSSNWLLSIWALKNHKLSFKVAISPDTKKSSSLNNL